MTTYKKCILHRKSYKRNPEDVKIYQQPHNRLIYKPCQNSDIFNDITKFVVNYTHWKSFLCTT